MKLKAKKYIPSCAIEDKDIAEEIRAEMCAAGLPIDNLRELVHPHPVILPLIEWDEDEEDNAEATPDHGVAKTQGISAEFYSRWEYNSFYRKIMEEGESWVTLRDPDGTLRFHYNCRFFMSGATSIYIRTKDGRELQVIL